MSAAVKRKIQVNSVHQEVGVIVRATRDALVVHAGGVEHHALRAKSCLVEPRENDEVLLALAVDGRAFVLAVLEGADDNQKTVVAVDGDLELTSRTGRVDIGAGEGIGLTSGSGVDVVGSEVRIRAAATTLVTEGLALLGQTVRAEWEKVAVTAGKVDNVFERVTQRVKRMYRFVEEREHVRAGALDYRAEKAVTIGAENAVVAVKEVVKIDGGQIQLG